MNNRPKLEVYRHDEQSGRCQVLIRNMGPLGNDEKESGSVGRWVSLGEGREHLCARKSQRTNHCGLIYEPVEVFVTNVRVRW